MVRVVQVTRPSDGKKGEIQKYVVVGNNVRGVVLWYDGGLTVEDLADLTVARAA